MDFACGLGPFHNCHSHTHCEGTQFNHSQVPVPNPQEQSHLDLGKGICRLDRFYSCPSNKVVAKPMHVAQGATLSPFLSNLSPRSFYDAVMGYKTYALDKDKQDQENDQDQQESEEDEEGIDLEDLKN